MKQDIFNLCLYLCNILVVVIIVVIIINKFNKTIYKYNKNTLPQLCGNTKLTESFEPYDGSYTNGFSVNNVLCSNIDVSKSLNTTADMIFYNKSKDDKNKTITISPNGNMTFYNTTGANSNKTDKNKTITISKDGNITIKSIDNIKIQEESNKEAKTLLQILYPVGSIYMSMNSTSPATFIGGEWTQIDNKFLYCTTKDSMKTGGADTVTLKTENLPSHKHGLNNVKTESSGTHEHNVIHKWQNPYNNLWNVKYFNNIIEESYKNYVRYNFDSIELRNSDKLTNNNKTIAESAGSHTHTINKQSTDSTGNNSSFSILPSYIKIYCWYRTK